MNKKMTQKMEENGDPEMTRGFTADKKLDLGILLELGSMGAGHATTALSEILDEYIVMEVPKLQTAPLHLIPKMYGKHDQLTTAIYMQLRGEASCDILLALDVEEAKKIAATMTMTSSPEDSDPEMEASAIEELGSIMICSFLSAIADFVDAKLVPMHPQLVTDSFDAIIDNFLVKQALTSDFALVFEGCFRRSSSETKGALVMFPSVELQELLVKKSQQWLKQDYSALAKSDQQPFCEPE
jgi:chemotaxis protein CheC